MLANCGEVWAAECGSGVREALHVTAEVSQTRTRKVLRVDMGAHKDGLAALAAVRQVGLSQLVRSALVALLEAARDAGELDDPGDLAPCAHASAQRRRCELRLDAGTHDAITALAQRRGFKLQGYVAALVRSHLQLEPQLGREELHALRQSNVQITALLQRLRAAEVVSPSFDTHVLDHLAVVRRLIVANQEHWRT